MEPETFEQAVSSGPSLPGRVTAGEKPVIKLTGIRTAPSATHLCCAAR